MKNNHIILSINRKGSFKIKPEQFHHAQCGKNNITEYRYEVMIQATNKKLIEPEMFVLDNDHIRQYFLQRYEEDRCVCRSCEIMAQEAIIHFKSLFIGKGAIYPYIDVQKISVIISGSEHSFIKAEWEKPNKK